MSAAHPTPPLDERARFEAWVMSLPERLHARLIQHIAAARNGPPWMREWLAVTDFSAPGHIPPVDWLEDIYNATQDIERGDYIVVTPEQLDRWIEHGESPWPDESSD